MKSEKWSLVNVNEQIKVLNNELEEKLQTIQSEHQIHKSYDYIK